MNEYGNDVLLRRSSADAAVYGAVASGELTAGKLVHTGEIMIRARKLGHVVLKVRDAAKSKEFYVRTLGLQIAFEDLERGMVFLSCGREHHELALFELATGETPDMSQPGLHHMAWQLGSLEELRAAYGELKTMGVPIDSTVRHNATSSVNIHDPDGNLVELYCDTVGNGFETLRTLGSRRDPLDFEQEPFVNERVP